MNAPPSPSSVLATLERFAGGKASTDEVMRTLVNHHAFFVPLSFAPRLGRSQFERIVMVGSGGAPPPGELYLFTDESCLDLVAKTPLGGFVTPVSGLELFCALDESVLKIKVNPGGPLSHFWYVGADAVPLTKLWGQAMRLEAVLADAQSAPHVVAAALRTFEAFTVLVHANGAVATAVNVGGFGNPAMVFTSPDSFQRVLDATKGLSPLHVGAQELFDLLPRAGVDGLTFNVMGPGPQRAFPLSVGASVLLRS